MATAQANTPAQQQRKRDITTVHVLRSRLRMPDDEYRELISWLFEGKKSSTELDDIELQRFVRHLRGLVQNLSPAARQVRQRGGGTRTLPPLTPMQGKMFSLWQQLADAGLVRNRQMSALRGWVIGHTHVDRWEWLNSHQEATVIESLKLWLKRRVAPAAADPEGRSHG